MGDNYAYDANGNTLTDAQGRSYSWDFENRLTQVVNPGVGTTTFKYDPFGRRIQKSSPLGTTNYLYSGGDVVQAVDGGGSITIRYAFGPDLDEPLSVRTAVGVSLFQADDVGSTTSLTNSTSVVTDTYSYDSFGNSTNLTGNTTNSNRYTGREYDSETGLYYYRARYYDPAIGRFLSEDPLQFWGGINFYAYARNSPIIFTDPSGLRVYPANFIGPLQPGDTRLPALPLPPAPGSESFIAATAAGFEGSTYWSNWGWGGLDGSVRPFSNKCNIFVGDVLSMNGITLPKFHPKGPYPLADDWANLNIPDIGPYSITTSTPQPGDVIALDGHTGIVVGPGQTASASALQGGTVVINDWGFRPGQHPTVRHCNSCGK